MEDNTTPLKRGPKGPRPGIKRTHKVEVFIAESHYEQCLATCGTDRGAISKWISGLVAQALERDALGS